MMFRFITQVLGSCGFLLCSSAALATLMPTDNLVTVPVTYNGIITSSPAENITLRLPGGETVPYTGPQPDYPFKAGDPIQISFNALVPSPDAIARGLVPASADGIYQFELGPRPGQVFDFPGTGSFENISGNGGIGQALDNQGRPEYSSNGGLAIVYDANNGTYSINTNARNRDPVNNPGDTFGFGLLDAPVLSYDESTNSFTTILLSALGSGQTAWSGLGEGRGRIPIANAGGSSIRNNQLNLFFDGAFNLPFFNNSIATPVPAPPALLLFGIGAGALVWRRRKRRDMVSA